MPAVEILLNTRHIAELIERGEVNGIKEAMEQSLAPGSQTFEQDLFRLYKESIITLDEALANADSPTNLSWLINNCAAVRPQRSEAGAAGVLDSTSDRERRLVQGVLPQPRRCRPGQARVRRNGHGLSRGRSSAGLRSEIRPPWQLARELIARRSVTPDDDGCLDLIAARLAPLGFSLERIDRNGVSNLWARRGNAAPLVCFAGHTDVVPPGPRRRMAVRSVRPTRARRLALSAAARPT